MAHAEPYCFPRLFERHVDVNSMQRGNVSGRLLHMTPYHFAPPRKLDFESPMWATLASPRLLLARNGLRGDVIRLQVGSHSFDCLRRSGGLYCRWPSRLFPPITNFRP